MTVKSPVPAPAWITITEDPATKEFVITIAPTDPSEVDGHDIILE